MRSWLSVLFLAALALVVAPGHRSAEAATDPLPIGARDASWGDPHAPVTLVVFTEYQCPYCGRLNDTLGELRNDYGPKQIRVVVKHFPLAFHKLARPAAEAAVAVRDLFGQDRFWEFTDKAFETFGARAGDWRTVASHLGLSAARIQGHIDTGSPAKQVEGDMALGESIGVRGTPATFVNGVMLSGARPKADFAAAIDAQLVAASAKRRQGVPAARVSAELTRENFVKPAPRPAAPPAAADDKTIWHVPVGISPTLGAPAALITVVTFGDFQCPFCGRLQPTLNDLRTKYGADLRLVFKHNPLPFHTRAEPAAQFVAEALAQRGERGFWEAHDLLFQNMRALEDTDLAGYATQLQLHPQRTMAAVQGHIHRAAIDADADLAKRIGAHGTPTSFINGRKVAGSQPIAVFEAVIDQELVRARALRAQGVPATRVYDAAIKSGLRSRP